MKRTDEAVSPVIAVILMVAITVVLAATVWVWVSGFGSQEAVPHALSLVSGGTTHPNATYTVTSASVGLQYEDMGFTLDGNELAYANLTNGPASSYRWCLWTGSGYCASSITDRPVRAGDTIYVQNTGTLSGAKLVAVDTQSNSVMLTLVIR